MGDDTNKEIETAVAQGIRLARSKEPQYVTEDACISRSKPLIESINKAIDLTEKVMPKVDEMRAEVKKKVDRWTGELQAVGSKLDSHISFDKGRNAQKSDSRAAGQYWMRFAAIIISAIVLIGGSIWGLSHAIPSAESIALAQQKLKKGNP